jgi:hypothetical protein
MRLVGKADKEAQSQKAQRTEDSTRLQGLVKHTEISVHTGCTRRLQLSDAAVSQSFTCWHLCWLTTLPAAACWEGLHTMKPVESLTCGVWPCSAKQRHARPAGSMRVE